jgi:hypothetical protein
MRPKQRYTIFKTTKSRKVTPRELCKQKVPTFTV